MKKLLLPLGLIASILLGCASSMSLDEYYAQIQGYSRTDVEGLLGKPNKVFYDDEHVFLHYYNTAMVTVMISPAIYQPYYDGKKTQQRLVQPARWSSVQKDCTTIITLTGDAVSAWEYEGGACNTVNMPQIVQRQGVQKQDENKTTDQTRPQAEEAEITEITPL